MTTKTELMTMKISDLRPLLSKRAGITGMRRQALSKAHACEVLDLHYRIGLTGDALYSEWMKESGIETDSGNGHDVNTDNGNGKDDGQGFVSQDDLAELLAQAIGPFINQSKGVDENAVNTLIDKKIKESMKVKRIEIKAFDREVKDMGVQHPMFETILNLVELRLNTMLVGPAGSGKTSACHAVADGLGLEFYCMSVGMQTTKSDLLGYVDANGKYVETILYKAYKNGGVFLLDEVDAGNANVITITNSMFANGSMRFPNGELVKKHDDFICLAAANTYGRGADRLYVGRNQLDAATLDRFKVINFDYDEAFETALAGNDDWTRKVQRLRKAAFDLKERVVISPRASIEGAIMLESGKFKEKDIEEMCIWKGIAGDIRRKIEQAA